jgi:hypothetical protein
METLKDVQTRLAADSRYAGAIDGMMGPVTMTGLLMAAAATRTPTRVMTDIAAALVAILPVAQLNTPLRICHFLAQATEETADWTSLVEEGGADLFRPI